jgi:hypothetical protein
LKQLHFWNENILLSFLCQREEVLGSREGLYKMGLSASNCREYENIFLSPCREKIHIHQMFPNAGPVPIAYTVEFIYFGTHRTGEVPDY